MELVVLILTLLSTQHICLSQAVSGDDIKTLLTTLFTTNSYNKDVRPSSDQSVNLNVYMDIYLMGINEIDVVGQRMVTTAYLNLYWEDEYLVWDHNTNNIPYIYIPQKNIWKPDLSLQNGFTKIKELGDDFLLTQISPQGLVYWRPFEVFETKCTINIKYFPFDRQTCTLEFGAWMMNLEDIDVEVGSSGFILDEFTESDEWTLEKTSAKAVESSTEGAKVIFSITVKRLPNYYILNIVLPVLFLSILMILTFAIPADSGEKMGYSMTVFLSFAVFLTIVSSSFPVTSETSIISTYLVILLSIGTLVVFVTGIELRLHFRPADRKVPYCMCKVVTLARRIQCRKHPDHNENEVQTIDIHPTIAEKSKPGHNDIGIKNKQAFDKDSKVTVKKREDVSEITWSDVVAALDFFFFYIFLIVIIVITIVMFTYAYIAAK